MRWILILSMYVGGGAGGRFIAHIEFDDKEACVTAAKAIAKDETLRTWWCVPKASKQPGAVKP